MFTLTGHTGRTMIAHPSVACRWLWPPRAVREQPVDYPKTLMGDPSLPTRLQSAGAIPALIVGLFIFAPEAFSQGCMPARFVALGLGARGLSHLEGGQWEASVNYRYLTSGDAYIGTEIWPEGKVVGARFWIHSIDLQATYAFTPRYSATLTMPFMHGDRSTVLDHDGTRHTTSAGGLGDVRLVGNAWLFDPGKSTNGNISLGIGVKAPTGDEKATDTFHKPTGHEIRPVDVSIQPGDGGWGIHLDLAGYQKIIDRLYGYVSGFYLVNPREENDAVATAPYPPPPNPNAAVRNNSVPDQYMGRIGLSYVIWPEQGLSLSFGGRVDGIPTRDLVGGSEGFRRPGYSVYVEPGVSWTRGQNAFNLFTPVMVAVNRQKNIYDDRFGTHGPAVFADFLIIASFSRKF